jgi:hypothetical protein
MLAAEESGAFTYVPPAEDEGDNEKGAAEQMSTPPISPREKVSLYSQ